MPTVSFSPSGKMLNVSAGTTLLQACRNAGFSLSTPCAEKGFCGKCRVRILSDNIPVDDRQKNCLPLHLLKTGWRAACIVKVEQDLLIADPTATGTVVLSDFSGREPCDKNAIWEHELTLEKSSACDQTDDFRRILQVLPKTIQKEKYQPCLPQLLSRLPGLLRQSGFRCRVTGINDLLLYVRSPEPHCTPTGLAVDIGTTTIAVALCDLQTGEVLATASQANPQSHWGDDVISRIECASRSREEVASMQACVIKTIEALSAEACRLAKTGSPPLLAAVAANTVMTHLFLGVSPSSLAISPFTPVFRDGVTLSGAGLGWAGDTPPLIRVLPCIAAFVGGDVVAGILVHDLHRDKGITLLLDAGTNGEIALSVKGKLYTCSTAAGPAFEGARISQGMRASPGAISKVVLDENGDLEIGTIDSLHPEGLCGTGLLDAIASLRLAGVIDEYGRIPEPEESEEAINSKLAKRIVSGEQGTAVRLSANVNGADIFLSQKDVREFQLAKGAIAAGIRILCLVAGIELSDIGKVLLAGGFGNYLDPRSTKITGLLPTGITTELIRPVGNSSLAGARLCLLSPGERQMADMLVEGVTHIELAGHNDFARIFAEEMLFPKV